MSDITREEPKESPVDWADLMARIRVLEADVKHERELRQLSESAVKKALELQAVEIKRRLDELNHAHVQKAQDFEKYLPRNEFAAILAAWETWRADMLKEQETWRESLRERTASLAEQVTANTERRQGASMAMGRLAAVIIGAVSVIATIMTLVITLTRK